MCGERSAFVSTICCKTVGCSAAQRLMLVNSSGSCKLKDKLVHIPDALCCGALNEPSALDLPEQALALHQ
eukprot:2432-Heterococcus_DN1.PRE.2